MTDPNRFDRRTVVRTIGGTALAVSLAGCAGDEGEEPAEGEPAEEEPAEGEPAEEEPAEEEPEDETLEPPAAVDDFLTEDDANGYEGDMVDATGEDALTVEVGSGDIGLGFEPVAVAINAGTTVTFEWTGEGGGHNVVAAEESDIADDVEQEEIDEAGHTAEYTFDESGNYLYICEPHVAQGKVGAIVVE